MNRWTPSRRPPATAWAALVLLSLALLHPVTAAAAVWFLPVPVVLWTVTGRPALAIASATVFGAAMWLGHLGWMALFFAIAGYAAGWVMGESLRLERTPFPALITGSLMFVMVELTCLAFLRWLGIDIFGWLDQGMRAYLSLLSLDSSVVQWQSSPDHAIGSLQTEVVDWLRTTLAGWIAVFGVCASLLNLTIARGLWPEALPRVRWLEGWRLPVNIVPVYLIALTASVFGWGRGWPPAWQAVNSLVVLAEFLLWMQGLAALWRRLGELPNRRWWWGAAAALATIVPLVRTLCVLYGMIDCMRDERTGS
jgi:hypothetical protein